MAGVSSERRQSSTPPVDEKNHPAMCTRYASRERCHDPLTPAAKESVCDNLCAKRFCSVGLQADTVDSSTWASRVGDRHYGELNRCVTQSCIFRILSSSEASSFGFDASYSRACSRSTSGGNLYRIH